MTTAKDQQIIDAYLRRIAEFDRHSEKYRSWARQAGFGAIGCLIAGAILIVMNDAFDMPELVRHLYHGEIAAAAGLGVLWFYFRIKADVV